jgi:hypothetical protein
VLACRQAIHAIRLSGQQQQRMVDGMAVFAELRQPIVQEMMQLQQQTHSSSNDSFDGDSNGSESCDGGSSSSLAAVQERSQLQQQEGKCDRLKLLMRKVRPNCCCFSATPMQQLPGARDHHVVGTHRHLLVCTAC